jgi:hypothetical protein
MTVPPWAGWEDVLAGVLVLTAAAVVLLLAALARGGAGEREDWQAWLAARPTRRTADSPAAAPGPATAAGPGPGPGPGPYGGPPRR